MASAASTSRRVGPSRNRTKKKKTSSRVVKKTMQKTTIKAAPQNASLSEKRRHAALISWEKRRAKAEKHTTASKKKSMTDARPVTPLEGKGKTHSVERQKIGASYTSNDRSQMSKASLERRRNQQNASDVKKRTPAIETRRKAAKLGWERRRNQFAATSISNVKKSKTSLIMCRGAIAKRQSAKQCRHKRHTPKAPKRITSSTSRGTPLAATVLSRAVTKSHPKRGSKRSRRLANESATSHEEGTRKMNNLVAYLRITRSWMEFHPSSRHGSGVATYGYIPSSIASFIRSGTISQRTVLDYGKLGVHYALDWYGYGGLKEMIDTFGEDYSPYPTEDMMNCARVPEWELGDDLPWRDVEEADDKLRKQGDKVSNLKVQESRSATDEDGDLKDILFLANILASLNNCSDRSNTEEGPSSTPPSSILAHNKYGISENRTNCHRCPSEECKAQENASPESTDFTFAKKCQEQYVPVSDFVDKDALILQTREDFKHWNFGIC